VDAGRAHYNWGAPPLTHLYGIGLRKGVDGAIGGGGQGSMFRHPEACSSLKWKASHDILGLADRTRFRGGLHRRGERTTRSDIHGKMNRVLLEENPASWILNPRFTQA